MISPRWSEWRKSNYKFFKKELENISAEKVVLDLGAGKWQFRDLFTKFENYRAVDFYPYEGISTVADLNKKFPFEDNHSDVIIISNVIEHIPYPREFLSECHRVLKPNGKIVGTTPFLMKIHQAPLDFNRYTGFMLNKVLKDSGFKDISVIELGHPLNMYRSVQKQFFNILLKSKLSRTKHFLARVARKLSVMLMTALLPLYRLASMSKIVVEGYGFKARK